MTTRLYYDDATVLSFEGRVKACEPVGDVWHVLLDRTAFYPTSGGQPHDTGSLAGSRVLDVIDRDDAEIVHVTTAPLDVGVRVRGEIDAMRRHDHMQQHTGQHVLSAAFNRILDVSTVSFHMGVEASTIDLAREVTGSEIERAEIEANRIVWNDLPVTVRVMSGEEADALPLRKRPARTGPLRLVAIQDFDLSACGGTHVATTGAIGMIAVTGWERFKGATRLSFTCGERARRSHARLRDVVLASMRTLSVSSGQLADQLERMQRDAKAAQREIVDLQAIIARYHGIELQGSAETTGRFQVVMSLEVADAVQLKSIAQAVVSKPGLVAVLVGSGQPASVVIARSADVDLDAGTVVKRLVGALGGRGGGRPELAQGGVSATSEAAAAFVRQQLSEM